MSASTNNDGHPLNGQPDRTPRPRLFQQLPVLLLRDHDAARVLAIGTRKLWELTDAGEIPAVYIGKSKRYRLSDLQEWVARRPAGKPDAAGA